MIHIKHRIDNERLLNSLDFGLGNNAVSHNESTGLIPSLAESDYQLKSYREICEYRQRPITRD